MINTHGVTFFIGRCSEVMASSARSAIAIVSIGDMGVGIAKLLIAKGFSVVTNINGRR